MFQRLSRKLNYQFNQESLLLQALTHKSYTNENRKNKIKNNERFEFLGDAILDLLIGEMLMQRFPLMNEGELSKARAKLVSEAGLSRVAQNLELGAFLRIGKGEEMYNGRAKPSLLADALEATIAAVYLDSQKEYSLTKVQEVVHHLFAQEMDSLLQCVDFQDYKTELQEYVQKYLQSPLEYRLLSETGPDHQKTFEIGVMISNVLCGSAKGNTKKAAAQSAAKQVLESFALHPPSQ